MQPTRLLRIYAPPGSSGDLHVDCPRLDVTVSLEHCIDCDATRGLRIVDDRVTFLECVDDEASGRDRRRASHVPVADVMTREVVTVSPDTPVETVSWLLVQRGIGGAPVVDAEGRLVGMITQSDLIRAQLTEPDGRPWGTPVAAPYELPVAPPEVGVRSLGGLSAGRVMTPVVYTLPDRAPVASAAALMASEALHRVPIVDSDDRTRLVGIVSSLDIVHWVARSAGYVVPGPPTDD